MNLTSRLRQLERRMALPDEVVVAITAVDRLRLDHLFEIAERSNGSPPCNSDGSMTSDMDVLAVWIDAYPG